MNLGDKFLNWLGYISHKEHTERYKKLEKEYSTNYSKKILELKLLHERNLKESSLPKYINKRRIGNTTRLTDWYIQELFTKGKITVRDHYEGNNHSEHKRLTKIILERIEREHRFFKDSIKVNFNKFTIELPDNK